MQKVLQLRTVVGKIKVEVSFVPDRIQAALFYILLVVLVIAAALVGLFVCLTEGVPCVEMTGFEGRTLWDWLQLLAVPAAIVGGIYLFNRSQRRAERSLNLSHDNTERQVAADRNRESAVQIYFDRMTELTLHEGLLLANPEVVVKNVARARTLALLRGLDGDRKGAVIRFLFESDLIARGNAIVDLTDADLVNMRLISVHLAEVDLKGADLRGAVLRDSNLVGADLSGASLRGADLSRANLKGACLRGVNLIGANLKETSLKGADLKGAYLIGADLRGANLIDAGLGEANLQSADLGGAYLIGADLWGANLMDAHLNETLLMDASLWGANLKGADLRNADLLEADLRDVNLREADLRQANLKEADLRRAKVSHLQLSGSLSLQGVILPDGEKFNGRFLGLDEWSRSPDERF
jgi:uncharacterized protein YjbI with pentapeptide repeats